MKRIIFAFVLIIICGIVCVSGNIITEKKSTELMNYLNQTESCLISGDYEKALEQAGKIEEIRDEAEFIFKFLSESDLIDELIVSLASLDKHIITDEIGHALILIEECKGILETVNKWQKLSLENIL